MTTAQTILDLIQGAVAVSLEYGSAILADGSSATFEPAVTLMVFRNQQGRCTKYHGRYKDGSQLHFTWHESSGADYRTFPQR